MPAAYLHRLERLSESNSAWIGRVAVWDGSVIGLAESCRYTHNGRPAFEVAVFLADAWQRRGIGSRLTGDLISRCCRAGVGLLTAEATVDNSAAIALARHGWQNLDRQRWTVTSTVRDGVRQYVAADAGM